MTFTKADSRNKYSLTAQSHVKAESIDFNSLDPAFRRATPNMTLATLACQEVLKKIPHIPRDQISFVLGTHFGEIGASLEFLKTYNETQVSRPILFQNSLHNSTLGFTTIQLGLTGPAITVSTGSLTAQSAFDLADNLLTQSQFVILCFVDCIPEDVKHHYAAYLPHFERYQNQAYAFLVASRETLQENSLTAADFAWDYFPCST